MSSENGERKGLLREIHDLLKEHPRAVWWMKLLGGSYVAFQILMTGLAIFIAYSVYSAFQGHQSKFEERKSAFEREFDDRKAKMKKVWAEIDEQSQLNKENFDKMDREFMESHKKQSDAFDRAFEDASEELFRRGEEFQKRFEGKK